jgi:hypothetical protein
MREERPGRQFEFEERMGLYSRREGDRVPANTPDTSTGPTAQTLDACAWAEEELIRTHRRHLRAI